MSDERLRELERKWQETGAAADRLAYAHGLERADRFEDIARVYQPLLAEKPELRIEYLPLSPLKPEDAQALERLLDVLPDDTIKYLIGSAVARKNYQDIDLLLCGAEWNHEVIADYLREHLAAFTVTGFPPHEGGQWDAYCNIDHRIKGTLNTALFDLCITTQTKFDDDRLRMRLQ
ncbi:hypothetical protein C4580_00205 [Candidatus Woesearchaeota archaeon]|nr:MAG: hypothetical protein C4580_00205 [Candidatus Woesearchaeota archaeon]